jgi:hypothetical protein
MPAAITRKAVRSRRRRTVSRAAIRRAVKRVARMREAGLLKPAPLKWFDEHLHIIGFAKLK